MDTREKIAVMQAFEDGKKIEFRAKGCSPWEPAHEPSWNWPAADYRIAPEPEKPEGRWVRIEVAEVNGDWKLKGSINGWAGIANLLNVPGFGGIEYRSPFDENIIARSTVPLMFDITSHPFFIGYSEGCRLGIPVAAWFWQEGEG